MLLCGSFPFEMAPIHPSIHPSMHSIYLFIQYNEPHICFTAYWAVPAWDAAYSCEVWRASNPLPLAPWQPEQLWKPAWTYVNMIDRYISLSLCVCIYIYNIQTHTHTYIYIYTYTYLLYIYIYTHIYIYTYIYIYIHIHIYIYIYIYIYIILMICVYHVNFWGYLWLWHEISTRCSCNALGLTFAYSLLAGAILPRTSSIPCKSPGSC